MNNSWQDSVPSNLDRRNRRALLFRRMCQAVTWMSVLVLVILIAHVGSEGLHWLNWNFVASFPSRFAEKAGIKAGIFGTLWLIGLTAVIAVPLGVAAAIYLEEYSRKSRLHALIEINISNLAGVPSIVYGILGLAVFARTLGLGRSVLAGALTMSLLVLPVIIIASREAIRAVPSSLRQASFALGATRWQTVRHHVLPCALPGIMTGVILALSRAIGETAPMVVLGALTYAAFIPEGPGDEFTTLPIQIFNWAGRPQAEFHGLAAAGILVLLCVLLAMNTGAVILRNRASRNRQW